MAKGWRKVGKRLAQGWRRVGGYPCTLQFCNSRGARLEDWVWVCDPECLLQGPETSKVPKWLGEGAKGVLDRGCKGLSRVFCTTKTLFCTSATLLWTNARGLWRPWPKRPFAPSPNHFWELSIFRPSPRTFGSQDWVCDSMGILRENKGWRIDT